MTMKIYPLKIFLACVMLLTFALPAPGAGAQKTRQPLETNPGQPVKAPSKPAASSGQTINTEYFSVRLPAGWNMAFPINKKPGGISAVFTNETGQVTLTINVLKSPLDVKKFVNIVWNDMKKGGLNPSAPRQTGKLYNIKLNGMPKGEAWFAANGKLCVATIVLTPLKDFNSANVFLQALKSAHRDMFPAKIDK